MHSHLLSLPRSYPSFVPPLLHVIHYSSRPTLCRSPFPPFLRPTHRMPSSCLSLAWSRNQRHRDYRHRHFHNHHHHYHYDHHTIIMMIIIIQKLVPVCITHLSRHTDSSSSFSFSFLHTSPCPPGPLIRRKREREEGGRFTSLPGVRGVLRKQEWRGRTGVEGRENEEMTEVEEEG